jgi:8-oxo-dGTP pyrophosphatase MutT (NUDIX family)
MFLNKILNHFGYRFQKNSEVYLPWSTCFHTVDIAVVDIFQNKLLLGQKPGKDYWVFVGGFTDPVSKNDEEDAVRELYEETDITINPNQLRYIGNYFIDDLRYINSQNKIRTHFFVTYLNKGCFNIIPKDDIEFLNWFDIKELEENNNIISPRHQHLFLELLNFMGK